MYCNLAFLEYHLVRTQFAQQLRNKPPGIYVDALTGSACRRYSADVIKLALYTDGVKLKKSTRHELWVLGATVLDLPLKIRSAQDNFVLIAAWYGTTKPIWSLMETFVNQELGRLILVGD